MTDRERYDFMELKKSGCLTSIVFLFMFILYGCAASHQTNNTSVSGSNTSDSFLWWGGNKDTTKTVTPPPAPVKQYFGVNGQINFNRVSYDNLPFQVAMDSLGLDAFRIPGGTFAGEYNYLVDTPSLYSVAMAKNYCHIGKVFLVLNFTQTVQQQISFLRLAHDLGIFTDSPYVEVFNEFQWQHSDETLDKCANIVNAVLSQFPKAQIGIPGGAPNKWNRKVLNRIPNVFLVDHYSNPKTYTVNGLTDTVNLAKQMDADRNDLFYRIDGSRIWVTEFNLQIADNSTPYFANDEQKALAVEFMFRHFKGYGFPIVLFHNIVMASGNGTIESTNKESHLTPTGHGFVNFKNSIK